MKLYSIKNLFEFRDFTFQGTLENLILNAGNMLGLGLPDFCVVCRKQTSGMFKTTSDQSSAFHFVQGYCAPSQAEISAYIHQLIMSQEKDVNSKLFANDVIIFKITYILYDIFTRTYLVCQFEQPDDGLTQFKTYGIESNRNITQLSKIHWEGAYISSVLRAIDVSNKLPCVGRFFNQLNICNPIKLVEFIKRLLSQLQNQDSKFQDLNTLKSKTDFPDIDDALYYLNWPIYILVKYLEECSHLEILIKTIDTLEDNIIFYLIKGILYYKIKDYTKCLQQIVQIHQDPVWFSFPYYLQAKAFIKLGKLENAFILLQELVVDYYENPLIWIAFSELFRKQQIYQISLLILNRANRFPLKNSARTIIDRQNLTNYKILSQNKNLQSPAHLETYYKLIHPLVAERVESFAQISSYPILDTILVRPRQPFKKDYKTLDQLVKVMLRAESRISAQTFDLLVNNDLLNGENCANSLIKETIKLFHSVGQNKIKSLIAQIFYQKPKTQKKIDQIYDPSEFSLNLIQRKNQLQLNVSSMSCTNKSMMNPRLSEEFDEDDSDEEKPNFLKPQNKMNKSFDFGPAKQYQTPQGRPKSPLKFTSVKKKAQTLKKTNTIIVENAFESVESERQNKKFQRILNDSVVQAPTSELQQQKNYIYSLSQYLTQNVNQQQQAQMIDQLMRRKEQIVPQFAETIDTVIKVLTELDQLFYPSTEKQIQGLQSNNISQIQSPNSNAPIFKSNLKKTLQNKTHLSRQAEFREYYIVPPQELEDQEAKDKFCQSQLKSESYFLFKCAKLAKIYKKQELALQIMQKIQNKVISVQVEMFLLKLNQQNPKQLIRQIQRTLCDFRECGINHIQQVPLWVEIIIARLAKQLGANQILALLSNSDTDFTFYLIKRVILLGENLA